MMTSRHALVRRMAGLIGTLAVVLALGPAATAAAPVAAGTNAPDAAPSVLVADAPVALIAAVGAPATKLAPVVSGLSSPLQVTNAGDGSGRLFVVEQGGRVRIVKNGVLLPTPFLDIHTLISVGGERGLLGIAFHPHFETNGKFYVYFTKKVGGDEAINEYRVSAGNPDIANRASGRRIMTIDDPFANHNGGGMAFASDGFLYIGTGDGGSAGDPGNRAQNLNSLLGKMLRIDVNGTAHGRQYRIPASNPYVGKAGRDEIWARGLRNPWRWSFDRLTGDLWIGDVGQDRYEEIDRSTVTQTKSRGRGVNYGWKTMEGRACFSPRTHCSTSGKITPVVAYSHSQGCSVVGGFVYRGSDIPALVGRYVFGDFCSGTIWSISRSARAPASKALLKQTSLSISSFGEDESGELYLVDLAGGTLYRFEAP